MIRVTVNHNDNEVQIHHVDDKEREDLISIPCKDTNSVRQVVEELFNLLGRDEMFELILDEYNEDKHTTIGEW